MNITIKRISKLHEYKSEWDNLYQSSNYTPFQSFEWMKLIIKEYKRNITLQITSKAYFAICYDEKVKIIFPFYVKKIGKKQGIFLLGSGGKTDYLDLLCDHSIKENMLEELFIFIKNRFKIDTFYFSLIRSNSFVMSLLNNMDIELEKRENECASIFLPKTLDEFEQSLSKKFKQNLRTAKNRLEKDGKIVDFETLSIGRVDNKKKKILSRIYLRRSTEKNGLSNRKTIFFIKSLIRSYDIYEDAINVVDNIILKFLYIDGLVASYIIYITDKQMNIYIPRLTMDNNYNRYSPGILLLKNLIEEHYNNFSYPHPFIDLTNGGEEYKYSFGAKTQINYYIKFKMNALIKE